jgi:hypothetical protein
MGSANMSRIIGPFFTGYAGIDYSGARTPTSSLKGLRIYMAIGSSTPVEIHPPQSGRKYWTRRGVAEWLTEQLSKKSSMLIGMDHGFSVPIQYFEKHGLAHNWHAFLEDFQEYWPTDGDNVFVDFVRGGNLGRAAERSGNSRWRRITERRAGSAKSVFHFDVPGSVAKSTHAGLPWLRYIRLHSSNHAHIWPFDGWEIPSGRSVLVEVYPVLWSRSYAREGRSNDQHDAYAIAAWMQNADLDGRIRDYFKPELSSEERTAAEIEGWILGVK